MYLEVSRVRCYTYNSHTQVTVDCNEQFQHINNTRETVSSLHWVDQCLLWIEISLHLRSICGLLLVSLLIHNFCISVNFLDFLVSEV